MKSAIEILLKTRYMGPTWVPPGADRTQVGPMLAPWILLSGTCITAMLTHGGRVTHICVSKLTIISSDNGLSPGWHQAIIWTNAGIWWIRTSWTNFSEILSEIHTFSFKQINVFENFVFEMAAICYVEIHVKTSREGNVRCGLIQNILIINYM